MKIIHLLAVLLFAAPFSQAQTPAGNALQLSGQLTGILPVISQPGIFTFQRSDESEAEFQLRAEISDDLRTWTAVDIGPANIFSGGFTITVTENGTAPDLVQFIFPSFPSGKSFARLAASPHP